MRHLQKAVRTSKINTYVSKINLEFNFVARDDRTIEERVQIASQREKNPDKGTCCKKRS